MDEQITRTARAAGAWWGQRLNPRYADTREAISTAIATRVAAALRAGARRVRLECDYEPWDVLLEAARETIDPTCEGITSSAHWVFPFKHVLTVEVGRLRPKEGYGNWTADILIP